MKFLSVWFAAVAAVALMVVGGVASASGARAFGGSDGPVAAQYYTFDGGAFLSIAYTGYLYECRSTPSGRTGNDVTMIAIARRAGEVRVLERSLTGVCNTPWDYNRLESAALNVTQESDPELWAALGLAEHTAERPVTLELAFESAGRWDSDYGRNFHVTLR